MNTPNIKNYEVQFLLSSNEAVYDRSLKKIQDIFTEYQVETINEEAIGLQTLAYQVNKNSTGKYYLYTIGIDPAKIDSLRKELRLQEDILRFLFIALDRKTLAHLQAKREKAEERKAEEQKNSEESSFVPESH